MPNIYHIQFSNGEYQCATKDQLMLIPPPVPTREITPPQYQYMVAIYKIRQTIVMLIAIVNIITRLAGSERIKVQKNIAIFN